MKTSFIAVAAIVALSTGAQAANTSVTSTSQTITINGTNFTSYDGTASGENSGGGSIAITGNRGDTLASASDANSLEIHGDRSRYVIGALYGSTASNGFLLSQLSAMTWDWNVAANGTGTGLAGAPVGRVIVADRNGEKVELVWEYPEANGGSPSQAAPTNQWNTVGGGAMWYANLRSGGIANFNANADNGVAYTANGGATGYIYQNGSQVYNSLATWNDYFSVDAKVIGISFGAGSGFGNSFVGYVDNVAVVTSNGTDRLNFGDVVANVDAVPEPATWGMMVLGFGLAGAAVRRRRATTVAA